MRLAEKYDVEMVQTLIKRHLQNEWPQSLAEWDARVYEIERYRFTDPPRGATYLDDVYPEPVAAINFALEFDVPAILPAAFYQLYTIGPLQDWTESRKPDYPDPDDYTFRHMSNGKRTARWSLLSQQGWYLFSRGSAQLDLDIQNFICNPRFWSPTHSCKKRLMQLRNDIFVGDMEVDSVATQGRRMRRDPLLLMDLIADELMVEPGPEDFDTPKVKWTVCYSCLEYLQCEIPQARRTLWSHLVSYFSLP